MSWKIGAAQWDVRLGDAERNFMFLDRFAREAAAAGVRLLVLPELWPVSFDVASAEAAGVSFRALEWARALSKELGLVLIGSALEREGKRLYNRASVVSGGEELCSYRKIHLFSPTGEPRAFARGEAPPPVVETELGRIGLVVCYDIRFPETVRHLYEKEVDLIAVPAQWASARLAHWKALLVARAIENQCFVVGANRCGVESQGGRETAFPGHSLILDPWGETLAEAAAEPGWIAGEFSTQRLAEVRKMVPARRDRRLN